MAAPKVQTIEQVIKDLNPAYQPGISLIDTQKAQLGTQYQAQRMGLDAQKVTGFNQINTNLNARGLGGSGITADEQSNYLADVYLPGQQKLIQDENAQRAQLDASLAQINQERRLKALDIRTSQQSTLQAYLAEERQRAWEKQKFAAEQAMERQKMAQAAAESAASRAASTPVTYSWSKQKNGGGYDVGGGVDLATAVRSQGGGISNLVSLLANGSSSDRKAAQYYMDNVGKNPVAAYNYLVKNTGAFYKGGGF